MSAMESEEKSHPPLKGLAKKGQLSKESDQRERREENRRRVVTPGPRGESPRGQGEHLGDKE